MDDLWLDLHIWNMTILVFLHFLVALVIVNYSILLDVLQKKMASGIRTLQLFHFYLDGWLQLLGQSARDLTICHSAMDFNPGPELNPFSILFNFYIKSLQKVFCWFRIWYH